MATVLQNLKLTEGGIWMNTHPEWNMQIALVGNGVSMVTLYYLRRFLKFFATTLENTSTKDVEVSVELIEFFNQVAKTLQDNKHLLSGSISILTEKVRFLVLLVVNTVQQFMTKVFRREKYAQFR